MRSRTAKRAWASVEAAQGEARRQLGPQAFEKLIRVRFNLAPSGWKDAKSKRVKTFAQIAREADLACRALRRAWAALESADGPGNELAPSTWRDLVRALRRFRADDARACLRLSAAGAAASAEATRSSARLLGADQLGKATFIRQALRAAPDLKPGPLAYFLIGYRLAEPADTPEDFRELARYCRRELARIGGSAKGSKGGNPRRLLSA